jgi:hypothetical protein
MFPHPIDRYRLIQRIVRLARATYAERRDSEASDLQAVVARRATVSPTIIANLENLEKCLAEPARKPGRDRFLKVLTWGLELPRAEIEALLWLLGEASLRPQEEKYYLGYLTDAERATPRDLTPTVLRTIVLERIGAVLEHAAPDSGSHTTAMHVYTATASGRLAAEQRLLELERTAGQRLRSAQLPSIVNFPASIHEDQAFVDRLLAHDTVRMDEAQRRAGRAIFRERMHAFAESLDTYGGRSIIEKASLVWYLTARDEGKARKWRRPLERRWEHMAGLIRLLDYPHFQIGLVAAGAASELEINLKTTEQIVLRSADHRELWDSNPQWGPRLFACDDRMTVLQFYYDFECAWDRIPPPDRDRDRVRQQLTALLNGARAGETEQVLLARLDAI